MTWNQALIFLCIILAGISSVAAISCYECNSNKSPECADSGRISSLYRDCSALPGQDRCIKTKAGNMVTRACGGNFGSPDGCVLNAMGNMETCTCSSNYCNTSNRLSSSGATTLCVVMLAVRLLLSWT